MTTSLRLFACLALSLVLLLSFFPSFSSAQEGAAGIEITPATIEDLVEPGEVYQTNLSVTNLNSEARTLFVYTREIVGVSDGGVPTFADQTAEVTGYEMTEWIQIEAGSFEFGPDTQRTLPITIAVPESATPGSHFAGIFISAEPPRMRTTGAGVGYEVVAIVSMRVAGDVLDVSRIRSFSTDKLIYSSKNVSFDARLENQGNILIRPRGPLVITNMLGGEAGQLIMNETQAGVYPGTTRDFSVSWSDDTFGFGRYKAQLALSYSGDVGLKTIDAALTFWVLPLNIIIPVLVGLVVLVGGGYIFVRLYIRRMVEQAPVGRRIAPQRYRRQVGISRFAFVFISILAVITLFLIVLLVLLA